ncbi:MAG: acetoacetate--CoA ligase [Gemmataceae bacterium]
MNPILWTPSNPQATRLAAFGRFVGDQYGGPTANDYPALHRWSLDRRGDFWRAVWQFADVIGDPGPTAYAPGPHMTDARWFPDGSLNFAENLLRAADDSPAIHFRTERGDGRTLTRRELFAQATAFAGFLRSQRVKPGDRVAAVLPNVPEAVVAMLGTAAVGAVWSSCSPDFGEDAIVDRFGQIGPAVLVTCDRTTYAGKPVPVADKVRAVLPRLPTVRTVAAAGDTPMSPNWVRFADVASNPDPGFAFERFPFAHPLAVLYSSGTTGAPKCIVHGAGGTLLQHLKEHQLHSDLRSGDTLFYFTTTGWMMWNWLASGLASGASIVLYDGSPFHPDGDVLWKLATDLGVTHFGASAKYLAHLEKLGHKPRERFDLSRLRVVLSTGSPLLPESFDYVYRDIKPDVQLASISGGTDIISCFALGCPTVPARRGELQVKGLGMDVHVYDDAGQPVVGEPGELVCASPFPSMPVGFWNDPDKRKYLGSYFERFDHVWCHGDWAEETQTGGLVIYGRSDTTLNPGGVRIGTAEIYQQVEAFPEVAEALATALRRDGDEQIVLFVRMRPGETLTDERVAAIKWRLRERCSPRHVPAFVVAAPDFPRTISGKLSEVAVRNAINGQPVRNEAALANPEALEFFRSVPGLL